MEQYQTFGRALSLYLVEGNLHKVQAHYKSQYFMENYYQEQTGIQCLIYVTNRNESDQYHQMNFEHAIIIF